MEVFSTYEAYLNRYKTYYDEEGDERPGMLTSEEFYKQFKLLRESYQAYHDLIQMGQTTEASLYYTQIINQLENQLAIADASDNFRQEIYIGSKGE
ncbi:hypothetical protein MK805_02800 [Shimazuella sp. AN120528]|uniref:hypothetical protein n=1 Tax=Shimazuella soli TaxID=1892854 RepID=UPI001F0CF6A3|nr:hypothetical protein [Shimazuella soli]MCH5583896.1 hypothetical protein [Shimazuella soli]